MSAFYDQSRFDVRLEWGLDGVTHLASRSSVVVIVDVLSFSTAVDIAVACGALVYPYRYRDGSDAEYARSVGALLAGKRGGSGFSLSPGSLRALSPGERLVLPSPNGATLSLLASEAGAAVLTGCLRNAEAVAQAARALGDSVTVIAAGEQWYYDRPSLRPSVEDAIGAGAIVAALNPLCPSPEAEAALVTFRNAQPRLLETLAVCSSGRELYEGGYGEDVELAAQLNASDTVPHLVDGAYRSWQ